MTEYLFPSGIAEGKAFCNRVKERKVLKQYIITCQHTVLLAPRRYGKTSLITRVSHEGKFPYCTIDFLMAGNYEDIQNQIIDEIGHLIANMLPRIKKSRQRLLNIFRNFRPEITLTAFGQKILLHAPSTPQKSIIDVMLGLDRLAREINKKVVVLMDEFQQIASLKNNTTMEATIRHAIERSKNVTYLFSGSKRNLLAQMFTGETRPLYRLCRLMNIERIQREDHEQFIQSAAKQKWNKVLSEDVLNEIINRAECHPFYVNVLCRTLWDKDDYPKLSDVLDCWDSYILSQKPIIEGELIDLSPNQKIILKALAYKPSNEPQANSFTSRVHLSTSSIKQSLEVLMRKDFVYIDSDNYYCVLDPAIKYFLARSVYPR